MQCLWCIFKHEQRKPFLQCLYFCLLLVCLFIFRVCIWCKICTVWAEQGFHLKQNVCAGRTGPKQKTVRNISSEPVLVQHYISRRSIKQQQVLLVDNKKQRFVSFFHGPMNAKGLSEAFTLLPIYKTSLPIKG